MFKDLPTDLVVVVVEYAYEYFDEQWKVVEDWRLDTKMDVVRKLGWTQKNLGLVAITMEREGLLVEFLRGLSVETIRKNECEIIKYAVAGGWIEALEVFKELGMGPEDIEEACALLTAYKNGRTKAIDWMLSNKMITKWDVQYSQALGTAVLRGEYEMVEYIVGVVGELGSDSILLLDAITRKDRRIFKCLWRACTAEQIVEHQVILAAHLHRAKDIIEFIESEGWHVGINGWFGNRKHSSSGVDTLTS